MLAGALLLSSLAAGCGHRPAPVTEVVFWQTWPPAAIGPLVRGFEAANPGVRVDVVTLPAMGGEDSIAAAVASGHPPDLCELGSGDIPRYLASGALSDWSAGVADLRDSLRGWPLCMVGDAIYGLPWQLGARALFCNRALFARAHVPAARAPQTWEQLGSAAARIQRLGGGVHGIGVPRPGSRDLFAAFMPFAWGNGGELLSAGLDSSRFDSRENLKALEFLVRLRRSAAIATQDSLEREFAAGRLGMLLAGTSLFARLPARGPAFEVGVTPVPLPAADRGEPASYARGTLLVSFTASRRKELALRLARWLARPENTLALAIATPRGEPSNVGADTAAWYRRHPARRQLVLQAATARFAPHHAVWDSMEIAVEEQVGLALYGGKPTGQAIADADARLAELAARKGR